MHQETVPGSELTMYSLYWEINRLWRSLTAASTGLRSTSNGISSQTKKQYYVRLKRLVDMGFIEKQNSVYKLTSFGTIVYENHLKTMEKIVLHYWQIKSVDVLKSRNDFPVEQQEKIISEYVEITGLKGIINTTNLTSFRVVNQFDDLIVEVLKDWIMPKRKFISQRDTMIRMFQIKSLRKYLTVLPSTYLMAILSRSVLKIDLLR